MELNLDDEDYNEILRQGGPDISDLRKNKELFLFRIPAGLINPSDLINQEICLKSGKKQEITLKDVQLEISSHDTQTLSKTSLFLPDTKATVLKPVDVPFQNQISMRGFLKSAENSDEQVVHSKVFHVPPNLKPRNFYDLKFVKKKQIKSASRDSPANVKEKKKKKKL